MELTLESLGSTAGAALPIPFGSQIGSLAGNLAGKLLGGMGGTKTAAGAFAGKHSMYLDNLDDSKINQPDATTYLGLATRFNLSVEEVAVLMAYDADTNGITAQQCWDGYAAGTSPLDAYISKFNAAGNGRIAAGQLGPVGASGSLRAIANYNGKAKFITLGVTGGVQAVAPELLPTSQRMAAVSATLDQDAPLPTTQQVPSLASNLTGGDLKKAAKAAYDGAVKGATDELMKTPEGKQAQNAGAKQWLNDNGLIIGLVISVVVGAFTWLISTRKR